MTRLLGALILALAMALGSMPSASAHPVGTTLVSGTVAFGPVQDTTTWTQTSDVAVVHVQSANLAAGETWRIVQPSAASLLVVRVTGDPAATLLRGRIRADGQVVLVNPTGFAVGSGAVVEAGGIVLSSLDAPNPSQILAKAPTFSALIRTGDVIVEAGARMSAPRGAVALLGSGDVLNNGELAAPGGAAALISSYQVGVALRGAPAFAPTTAAGPGPAEFVRNDGLIDAPGGTALLHADTSATITSNGVLRTSSSRLASNRFYAGVTSLGRVEVSCALIGGALRADVRHNGAAVDPAAPQTTTEGPLFFDRRHDVRSGAGRTLRVNALQGAGAFDEHSQYGALSCAAGVLTAGRPRVLGMPTVGRSLSAIPGAWSPAPASYGYQWLRDGAPIPGATGRTRVLTAADAGHLVSVRVTGAKAEHESAAGTAPAVRVGRAFTRTPRPGIDGAARKGKRLTAKPGRWRPGGARFAYQWLRAGTPIPGATKRRYRVTAADVGRRITVRVTGSKPGYTPVSRTSAAVKVRRR